MRRGWDRPREELGWGVGVGWGGGGGVVEIGSSREG
jgi:hypothetical protein